MMSLVDQIGWASVIATLVLRIVPIVGIIKVFKTGDIRHIPFLIYFTCLLSTTFFTIYGLQNKNWEIWVINGSAVIIMPFYLTLYVYYLPGTSPLIRLILLYLLYFLTISTILTSYFFPKDLNGKIASILSFVVQSSQIYTVSQVLYTKNSVYIDILFIYAFATTNIFNTVYGLLKNNIYLWGSMSWGLVWNIIQIIMYHNYPKDETVSIIRDKEELIISEDNDNYYYNENKLDKSIDNKLYSDKGSECTEDTDYLLCRPNRKLESGKIDITCLDSISLNREKSEIEENLLICNYFSH